MTASHGRSFLRLQKEEEGFLLDIEFWSPSKGSAPCYLWYRGIGLLVQMFWT